ncbi:hypothetical protein HPG69_016532, partial [Diceros bicornis minor]
MAWRGLAAEFLQVPAVTRAYTAACVLTTAAVVRRTGGRSGRRHCYNPGRGSLFRYCRMLEEEFFRGRKADFVFMFLFGGVLMTVSFSA